MNKNIVPSSFSDDDKFLIRHILDLAKQSEASRRPRYSAFLDERQQALCVSALKAERIKFYRLYGGYENADRAILIFNPENYDISDSIPIVPVVFNYREKDELSHRDFLGSIMSMMIKREMLGDILVNSKRSTVFVHENALSTVCEINKIGRVGVSVSFDFSADDIPLQKFEQIKSTVASLRLDAVVSSALRLSRDKSSELIKSHGVILNRAMTYNPSARVDEGDKFSIKGFGKFILFEVGGNSKKDRIFITINKFI